MMRCISFKELRTIVPVARVTIDRWESDPKYMGDDPFPARVQLGQCRVCWWLHEVLDWLERRSKKR